MTNLIFKTKPKTYQEVWQKDKELLMPVMQLDGDMPTSHGAWRILLERQKRWENPAEVLVLDKDSLKREVEHTFVRLEDVWGTKLAEMPNIEICSTQDYLPRIQELDREVNREFGYGGVCMSPPTMGSYPFSKTVVIPKKFIARGYKGGNTISVESDSFDIFEYEWDKAFFEEILFGGLSQVLFRQERGEWGKDYVKVMKRLGDPREIFINFLNEAAAQYAKDKIAEKNGWNLYVVSEKIGVAWQNRQCMESYRAIDSLLGFGKLVDLCKADEFFPSTEEVAATFYLQHPSFGKKYKDFKDNVKIKDK